MGFIDLIQVQLFPGIEGVKRFRTLGLFISGFRILEGLLAMLGFLKITASFDIQSQAVALVL